MMYTVGRTQISKGTKLREHDRTSLFTTMIYLKLIIIRESINKNWHSTAIAIEKNRLFTKKYI